jgi:hypothetical protein
MKILRATLFAVFCLLPFAVTSAQLPPPPISGFVHSAQFGPVAGVTVSLVHPMIGRSSPVFTGPTGGYFFSNVPVQSQPYYIEAYWGNQLLYRGILAYVGAPVRLDIPLP